MRKALVAAAALFLAAHLPFLPPTLEDIDSVNFALGVREYDVARHQPHPPGYPVFIAMSKVSTALAGTVGVPAAAVRGIAIWSVVSGTALVFLLFGLYRTLSDDDARAWWATVLAVVSPLFWFTALRPLSDMTGLAAAVAAQALLASVAMGRSGPRMLLAGAFIAGLAIGVRSQTFALTLPLLGFVLVMPGLRLAAANRLAAIGAFALGVVSWGVPLLMESGGLSRYSAALGSQAGEDFSGVVMLWTSRTARVAADALAFTVLWPWGNLIAGAIVALCAAAGAALVAWKAPRAFVVLSVAFAPYAIFHVMFHETVTVRYALPLTVPLAFLAASALARVRYLLPAAVICFALYSATASADALRYYGSTGNPAFALIHDLRRDLEAPAGAAASVPAVDAVAYHAVARRAFEWDPVPRPMLRAVHGREWLRVVEAWRTTPGITIAFAANARRTDLVLFDPQSRKLARSYRWGMDEMPFVGGARPGNADLYWLSPPGWMLDRGWALTAEVAGVTARDGGGPHVRPSIAWVAARTAGAELMIGGRHLGGASDPPVEITLTAAGRPLAGWQVQPGFFFQRITVPPGTFAASDAFVPLEVTSKAVGQTREIPVALEQFDLQPDGTPMTGFVSGWQEPEYNPQTGAAWRWMTRRGALWVRPIGRDVTLTLAGESPSRYYGEPAEITVAVGPTQVARLTRAEDFRDDIVLPAGALAAANGEVTVHSSRSFVPGERDGSADRRELALRIYSVAVR